MDSNYKEIARLMVDLKPCVALTGAGISAESGIPTFRSKGGLWEKYDPMVYASIETFREDPSKYWTIRGEFIRDYDTYQPNKAHLALAELEEMGIVHHVITQNIDGLHEKSGLPAERIVNLHGNTLEVVCLKCGVVIDAEPLMDNLDPREPPACQVCQGLLKPNTISFGQQLVTEDLDKAERLARDCDLMIAFGSTLKVQPAASFPLLARESGAKLVIVTMSDTPLDAYADFVFHQNIDGFLEQIGS